MLWQKRLIDNDSTSRQMEYWRRDLARRVAARCSCRRIIRKAGMGCRRIKAPWRRFILVPLELTQALKQLSRDEGVTFLLRCCWRRFKALMHRYSGQEDIIVGGLTDGASPCGEFTRPGMGYFLNTLPLRTFGRRAT